jgi:soluble lytic murein transglycosylase-like protein
MKPALENLALSMLLIMMMGALRAEVPRAYHRVATEYQVPVRLLYAVALQESRTTLGAQLKRPWPWTLNVAGVGYRYGSRQAAFAAINQHLASGEARIDIGLMQVHWRFHKDRLGSVWAALSPYHNLRVGASILRDCYQRMGDWSQASGCYHSGTAWRAARYAASVGRLQAQVAP